ncbi:beta-defensin 134 [Cavia porcellus]|uniref:beta-defensin 134 n=1 Tax=Cavia porcellus TaxID=10141 RepID=UPI000C87A037|nr:beta-defensin 134 [Cavia porcellus]
MKPSLLLTAFFFFCYPVLAGLNPVLSVRFTKCYRKGICRFECLGSEMLVAYCMFQLECCVAGDPGP